MKPMPATNQKPANTNRYIKTQRKNASKVENNHQATGKKQKEEKNRKELQKQVATWQ